MGDNGLPTCLIKEAWLEPALPESLLYGNNGGLPEQTQISSPRAKPSHLDATTSLFPSCHSLRLTVPGDNL